MKLKHDFVTMKLSDLKPAKYNPRKISKDAKAALTASVKRFGLVQPIVWNKRSKNVVGGHQRLDVLREQGQETTTVVVVDLDPKEEKALNLTLNNPHIEGKFTDGLQTILAELSTWNASDLTDLRLDALIAGTPTAAGHTDPDDIPAAPPTATTKRGQRWILGNHYLYCGDSAKPADLDALLVGAKIHLVNTDPPYNVKVEPRSNNAIAAGKSSFSMVAGAKATHKTLRAKDLPIMNDNFLSDADFVKALGGWFGNIGRVLTPGRAFYIWGGYANCANYPKALDSAELYFSQTIIWVKQHPVINRKDFMGNHEWCFYGWRQDADNLLLVQAGFQFDHRYAFYGWKEGAGHYFHPALYNATDVWEVKKVTSSKMVHLTEKPVELAVRAISYSSRPSENVLDLFGGSGSTLIAAEQTGRNAYLMEMEPLYCDVIITRWQNFTGKKARLDPNPPSTTKLDKRAHS